MIQKDPSPFGDWLKSRREALYPRSQPMARAALAAIAGREPDASTWSKWENGEAFPSGDYLAALEKMFGTDWPRAPMPPDLERQLAELLEPMAAGMRELVQELRELRSALRR